MLHVLLEVEIGKAIVLTNLKELGKLGVGVDDATIGLILKVVGIDVGVNLLADIRASHLGSNGLAKELSKLIADASGLDKAGGLAVATGLALLRRGLLGVLHLTANLLIEVLELVLESRGHGEKLLDASTKLVELHGERVDISGNSGINNNGGGRGGSGRNLNRGSNHGLGGLLHTRSLSSSAHIGNGGNGCNGRNGGDNGLISNGLSSSNHSS
uniref:Uncharacterized protein n=1 Tax=viral metagenome TaxID=1070528 RepID=A0A6C0H1H6_9ZZZZ